MRIFGLQKLTLLDYPGHTACTVFTGGCNFRCPFCHNASLVEAGRLPDELDEDEVFALLDKRRGLLDGVCVTGGEPLLQPDLPAFLAKIKEWGFAVKLDTNGSFPERLRRILEAGLADYVAMDVKNAPERYAETAGLADFDPAPIAESIALLNAGRTPCEFRTTVARELHSVESIASAARWIAGAKRYYLQMYKDSGDILSAGLHPCTEAEMRAMADAARPYVPAVELRGI
jgi:pyruvate formate lyase activating enzyme